MKNNNYKILGYVYIILVFAAVASLLYYREVSRFVFDYQAPLHKEWQTFTDASGTFEIMYPKEYPVSTPSRDDVQIYFNKQTTKASVRVDVPKAKYPNTNFSEAWVLVATDSSINNAADCKKYSNGAGSGKITDKTENINGKNFDKAEFSGAAAGNLYEIRLYRVFHAGTCFEVSLNLHTANIGNYPEGTVTEVNKGEVWSRLVQMLNTFKFQGQDSENSSESVEKKQTGILKGHVSIGPLCPVEPCGRDANFSSTKILIYAYNGLEVLKTVTVNAFGNYSVDLEAGKYSIDYQSNYGLGVISRPRQVITIEAGKSQTVNFSIDTGIR